MSNFTKIFLSITLLLAIVLPVIATKGSWGIRSETNLKFQTKQTSCASNLKNEFGNCKRTHRSNHTRRSYYGGGPRSGK